MFRQVIFLVQLLLLIFKSDTFSQDIYYKDRGNRYEGIKIVGAGAPDLELLSFTSYRENVKMNSNVDLKLKFYVWEDTSLYITAKELDNKLCYFMKPKKTRWSMGWQQFYPWPTNDVLHCIKISPDELGIIARMYNDEIGSRMIVPVILYHSKYPSHINKYTLVFLARQFYNIIDFKIYRIQQKIPIYSNQLRQLIGGLPFSIMLDLAGQSSGFYRLEVNCIDDNGRRGPQRYYFFYHQPEVDN